MIAILIFVVGLAYGTSIPSDLKKFLFEDYDLDEMPTSPLDIGFGLKFSHIDAIDELMNSIATSVWVRLTWVDPRLRWDKAKFNNTESIYVPVQATGISSGIIWGPTVRLWNPSSAWQPQYQTEARVTSEGIVTWSRGENMNIMCTFIGSSFPLKKAKCPLELGAWTNVLERYYIREDFMDFSLGGVGATDLAYMIDTEESIVEETTWEGPLDTYHYISLELVVRGYATSKILSVVVPWILQVQVAVFYPFFSDKIDPMFLILQVVAACSTLTFSITSENFGATATDIAIFSAISFLSIFIFHGLNLATSQYIANRSEKHHVTAHFFSAITGFCVLTWIGGYATSIVMSIESELSSVILAIFGVSILAGYTVSMVLTVSTGIIYCNGLQKSQITEMLFASHELEQKDTPENFKIAKFSKVSADEESMPENPDFEVYDEEDDEK